MNHNIKQHSASYPMWTHTNEKEPEGTPRYVSFSALLSKDSKEMWDTIKRIRHFARSLNGTRICYERTVTFSHSDRLGEYELVVPRMEEQDILAYEGLGVDMQRIYRGMSRKKRRKYYQKIRL